VATSIFLLADTEFELPSNWRANLRRLNQPHDPLHGVKLKIARANEHLGNIETIADKFSKSHSIIREAEPDGIYDAIKIKIGEPPPMLAVIIGEVAFQLRSALDQLATALAVKNGKSPSQVYFPIAGDRQEFRRARTQGKIEKLSPAARKLIWRLKPYKGGNNLLWALNSLRNADVHIALAPLALGGPKWGGRKIRKGGGGIAVLTYPQTFEKELVLLRCPTETEIEHDLQPEVAIAFGDIEFLEGESVVTRLRQLIDLTERIVSIFQRRFF
jgi:hypothetical protein